MSGPLDTNDIGLGPVFVAKPSQSTIVHMLEIEVHPANKSIWRKTWAHEVPGGWIVYCQTMSYEGESALCSTYVPDADHTWFSKADGRSDAADDIEGTP